VIEEEIHALLQEGSESGAIEAQEREMVRNVFRLDDRPVESLMTPRADIVYLDTTLPLQENLRRVAESEHVRFPVCHNGLDEVLGILNAKQLLDALLAGASPSLTESLQPPCSCRNASVDWTCCNSSAHPTPTWYWSSTNTRDQWLATLQDVLETLTGEFKPRRQEEAWAVQRADGSWILDGLIPIPELKTGWG